MSDQRPESGAHAARASRKDVMRILRLEDAEKIVDILALKPTLADLDQAVICAGGDADILAKAGHPPGGVVAQIVDIVSTDEDEEPPPTG